MPTALSGTPGDPAFASTVISTQLLAPITSSPCGVSETEGPVSPTVTCVEALAALPSESVATTVIVCTPAVNV